MELPLHVGMFSQNLKKIIKFLPEVMLMPHLRICTPPYILEEILFITPTLFKLEPCYNPLF